MSSQEEKDAARRELESEHGSVWDTTELQRDFTVEGFAYGVCIATRKSDNVRGTLDFTHSPRFYYSFSGGK